MDTPAIIVEGNLSDGYRFFGPFASFDEASEYAEKHLANSMTWIATLKKPKP